VRDMVGRVKSLLMTHEARSGLQEEPV